ncbi:MAG: tRNA pseudouridine(38-40) synthase TruA [Finegoldia sp.]|nr:tRNA pseudouridine(38-40) synthase TruA [Finegoldia sp.]
MKNIKLTLQYDGSKYYGWQRLNDLPSVQKEIEEAIARLTCEDIKIIGAGRTDKGVHARGQVCNFLADTAISANRFLTGINHFTSDSVVVTEAEEVDLSFHARFSAKRKTYKYILCNKRYMEPWFNDYKGHRKYFLDYDKLLACKDILVGTHDFSSFANDLEDDINPIRTIDRIDIERRDCDIIFTFTAESFLKNMVRIMVGSMVDVARGKRSLEWFEESLEKKNRQAAGKTIEPSGLYLWSIEY